MTKKQLENHIPIPFQDRVVITKKMPEMKTAGGIIIPETVINKENEGLVVAVGPSVGKNSPKGESPNVGDKVLFGEYAGVELNYKNQTYLVVKEADILCKI